MAFLYTYKYDFTYTERVKELLEGKYKSFEKLHDYYIVKKTGRRITQKSNLFTMASNSFFERIGWHIESKRKYSYSRVYLKKELGSDYSNIIQILFKKGKGYVFKKTTIQYELKEGVIEIFNDAFTQWAGAHKLLDKEGKYVGTEILERSAVNKFTLIDGKESTVESIAHKNKMNIPNQIKLNVDRVTEGVHLYRKLKDFHYHKTSLDKREKQILKSAGLNFKNLTDYKVERFSKIMLELMIRINQSPFEYGHIFQIYNEIDSGRIYNEGQYALQYLPKHIRYIILSGLEYYEYDFVNCHFELIRQMHYHYGGKELSEIDRYCKASTKYRKELADRINVSTDLIKALLIQMINGSTLNWSINVYSRKKKKMTKSAILEKMEEYEGTKPTARLLAEAFTKDASVIAIHKNLDNARRNIKKHLVTTGNGHKLYYHNHYGKKHPSSYMNKVRGKNKWYYHTNGKIMAFLLQGMEISILNEMIKLDNKNSENFLVPYHDGWITKKKINKDVYQKHIEKHTKKLFEDYDGYKCKKGISLKVVGGELRDPFKKV